MILEADTRSDARRAAPSARRGDGRPRHRGRASALPSARWWPTRSSRRLGLRAAYGLCVALMLSALLLLATVRAAAPARPAA